MIKSIHFPTKEFETKEELFSDLKANIKDIIDLKKAQIQKSCDKGTSISFKSIDLSKFSEQNKAFKLDENYYYIAVNSTNILDSHDDLHVKGIWKKSISEQQGKNYLVLDHELELDKVVVKKEYIEMFTQVLPFSVLGKDYAGNSEVLIYKFPKDKVINETAEDWLESGDSLEASVRMQYVTILLAMDSNNPEDETEKMNYDNYIDEIANKDDFEYIPYFFIIKEAKNIKESSLVVFGSNHATGTIQNNSQADKTLDKTEPLKDTQTLPTKKIFIN